MNTPEVGPEILQPFTLAPEDSKWSVEIPVETYIHATLSALAGDSAPTLEAFRTGDDRDDLARYGLCLVLEAAELINALPWKRWARHPSNIEKATEEFADLMCFLGSLINLFGRYGVDELTLTQAYLRKRDENRVRFARYLEEQGEGT